LPQDFRLVNTSETIVRDVRGPFQACLRHAHHSPQLTPLKWRATINGPYGTSLHRSVLTEGQWLVLPP